MAKFNNLKSLHDHLERHAADYAGAHRISRLFEAVYKLKESEGKRNEADKTLWERKLFAVQYDVGEPKKWCDHIVADFDKNTYDYAATKLENTQNPILRARYAHVLLSGPNKVIDHAQIAIDSYLETAKVYEQKDCIKLKDKRHFNCNSIDGLQDICWKLASRLMRVRDNPHLNEAKDMLNLGEKIDKRLNQTSHNWNIERAKCFETLMQIKPNGDPAIPFFCRDAIENYEKAGATRKMATLKRQYPRLAGSIRLCKGTVMVDQTDSVKQAQHLAEKLVGWPAEKVISFLIHQREFLPQYGDIQK